MTSRKTPTESVLLAESEGFTLDTTYGLLWRSNPVIPEAVCWLLSVTHDVEFDDAQRDGNFILAAGIIMSLQRQFTEKLLKADEMLAQIDAGAGGGYVDPAKRARLLIGAFL